MWKTEGLKKMVSPLYFICIDENFISKIYLKINYLKSVRVRSYSGPHVPAFGLNTKRYFVSLRTQSKCGKMRTRITPNTHTFYAVVDGP